MSFLALLIALMIFKVWDPAYRIQVDQWFDRWHGRVSSLKLAEPATLALAVLVPLMVCLVVLTEFRTLLFGLPWLAAAILLLLYSFGRGDYAALVAAYQDCLDCDPRRGDSPQVLQVYAMQSLDCTESELPVGESWIEARLLYLGYERLFAVLFWFWLFGPLAALAYRLLQLSARAEDAGLVHRLLFWVDWLPARALAALFTLVGDFVAGKSALLDSLDDTQAPAGIVLQQVARASLAVLPADVDLGDGESGSSARRHKVEQVSSLLTRAVIAWIVVIALWILLV